MKFYTRRLRTQTSAARDSAASRLPPSPRLLRRFDDGAALRSLVVAFLAWMAVSAGVAPAAAAIAGPVLPDKSSGPPPSSSERRQCRAEGTRVAHGAESAPGFRSTISPVVATLTPRTDGARGSSPRRLHSGLECLDRLHDREGVRCQAPRRPTSTAAPPRLRLMACRPERLPQIPAVLHSLRRLSAPDPHEPLERGCFSARMDAWLRTP
jgi:hypothetical protein